MKSMTSTASLIFFLTFALFAHADNPVAVLNQPLESMALSPATKDVISRLLPNKNRIYFSDILGLNTFEFREANPHAYEEVRKILLRSRKLTLDLEPCEIEEFRRTGRAVYVTPQSRIERLKLRKQGIQDLQRLGVKQIWEINNITDAQWDSMKWESSKLQIPRAVDRMESRLLRRPRRATAPRRVKVPALKPNLDMDPPLRGFKNLRDRGLLTIEQLHSKSERWIQSNFDVRTSRRLIDLIRSVGETYLDELEVAIAKGYLFRPINADLMNIAIETLDKLGNPATVAELLEKVDELNSKSPLSADRQIRSLKTRISIYREGCNRSLREAAE